MISFIGGFELQQGINTACVSSNVSFERKPQRTQKNSGRDTFVRSSSSAAKNQKAKVSHKKASSKSSGNKPPVVSDSLYHFRHERYEYNNVLAKPLKAEPNAMLIQELKRLNREGIIHHVSKATTRISSLSRYLKEDMVGFVTPDGQNWFEGACEFIIKGSAGKNIANDEYVKYAKQFWALMALADKYWLSEDFVNYLDGFKKPNAGVEATITAIKELQDKQTMIGSEISFGYVSKLRYINKLLTDGCAYSGVQMNLKNSSAPNFPTMEHIFPHSIGGDDVNVDCNYLVTCGEPNGLRSSIPLVMFLKGWDAVELMVKPSKQAKKKKTKTPKAPKRTLTKEEKKDKKILDRMFRQLKNNANPEIILSQMPERLQGAFNDLMAKANMLKEAAFR